jgi:hypothetical protein
MIEKDIIASLFISAVSPTVLIMHLARYALLPLIWQVSRKFIFCHWRLVRRLISLALKTGTFTAVSAVMIVITYAIDEESNGTHILIFLDVH